MKPSAEILAYYATPGPLTKLPQLRDSSALPSSLAELCLLLQGSLVHPFMGGLYSLQAEKMPLGDVQLRSAEEIVTRLREHDSRPFGVAREPARRFCGNCRHFSVLLAALLRRQGVPARARCGFGAYFDRGRFVDHWVAEVWDAERSDWRLVDAQLDAKQRETFRIPFDPLDVPRTEFVVAGDAWQQCRSGAADPARFGILDLWGLWFIQGNVVREVAAFSKRELLPWDVWGSLMTGPEGAPSDSELALLDRAAALTLDSDARFAELRALHDENPAFRVPPRVFNVQTGRDEPIRE